MEIRDRQIAFEGNYLRIVRKGFRTNAGLDGTWEAVERTNIHGSGAVVVAAVTCDGELILERNFRVPVESYVIQFPAGLTDKRGESEEEAARRELLEETGYLAKDLTLIANVPLAPALSSTKGAHFYARSVEYVGKTREDANEEIEVLKIPLAEVGRFLLDLPADTMLDLRVPGILWMLEKSGHI